MMFLKEELMNFICCVRYLGFRNIMKKKEIGNSTETEIVNTVSEESF